MSKPVAVLISDVHYNINTIEVADKAMRLAIDKANDLGVRLIVCGDLHDTKAHVRGECIKFMIDTFLTCDIPACVIRGNHDSINEKSTETSLTFLNAYVNLVTDVDYLEFSGFKVQLIAYNHDPEDLRNYLATIPKGSTLIMHQGIQGSNSGEYFQDKSAITPQDVAGFRVISGHYHNRQTIELPDGGKWDYVGNPYTLNFAEANDPPKGFQILYDDGSLEFVPTNLRKHVIVTLHATNVGASKGLVVQNNPFDVKQDDIVWVKIWGQKDNINSVTKKHIAELIGVENFKLELIPDEQISDISIESTYQTKEQVLDGLIDSLSNTTVVQKQRLKAAWRDFV